ncbi:hypothetical protein [Bifidobacterium pseudocatenulatum]|jgi:hypothetical protein|uniref:hypothetical protein n=1 Tax=Bifidobacterium pseudocatenulatum TaxID=28026 RepID=UPI003562A69D
MTFLERRDQILQNLRDLFTQLSEETDETRRTQIEAKCREQLDLLELNDKVGNTR